jgi:hypothetical protein
LHVYIRLHTHNGRRCMLLAKQNRLTCLQGGSTSLRSELMRHERGRVICANLMSQENLCGQYFEIQTQLGICCVACQAVLLASRSSTATGVSDHFLKRSSVSARRDTSSLDRNLAPSTTKKHHLRTRTCECYKANRRRIVGTADLLHAPEASEGIARQLQND